MFNLRRSERDRRPVKTGLFGFPGLTGALRAAKPALHAELLLRCVTVALVGGAIVFASGSVFVAGWLAFFLATNVAYYCVVRFHPNRLKATNYKIRVVATCLGSFGFAIMPVYVWIDLDLPGVKFVALCGVFCHVLFNLGRFRGHSFASSFDTLCIVGTVLTIAAYEFTQTNAAAQNFLICVGAAAPLIYFLRARQDAIEDRRALEQSRNDVLQAQKMSTVGQATAGVAHDFNNMLTIIRGNIELAEISVDPSDRRRLMEEARGSADKAATVIAQMLSYARKAPIQRQPIDLKPYLERLRCTVRRYVPANIKFRSQLVGPAQYLSTDEALLETALLNLIINARDAIGRKPGIIDLRISEFDALQWHGKVPESPDQFLQIVVTDTGPGIPEENLSRVLDPFNTTKPMGAGSGLGLSMVKSYVEQSGGTIHLRNNDMTGLEVGILLPRQ